MERIDLYRLEVPLVTPYRLAFGPVAHFDTILVEITDEAGHVGLGEATVLTGYTDETIDESWRVARALAGELIEDSADEAHRRIFDLGTTHPFTATAFGTAYEMAQGSALLDIARPTRVPLLGLLNAEAPAAMEAEVEQLLAAGFATLKMKVGFDAERDAERVDAAQRIVAGRARLRIDANQGYTAEQGVAFVRALDPEGIELFEQPCRAGDWKAHLEVARAASVPMMLDESIYGLPDIERAAELDAARYVKVKLMKLVTLEALVAAIGRIRDLGMRAVLGNGVACEVSCWMEACVASRTVDNAGEMNGFLKPRFGLLSSPLTFDRGAVVLAPGFVARLDRDRVAAYRVDSASFARRSVRRTAAERAR